MSFAGRRRLCRASAKARVGRPVHAPAAPGPSGPGRLARARAPKGGSGPRPRMAGTLLRNAPSARSSTSSPSRRLGAARYHLGWLRCSAPSMRALARPFAALRARSAACRWKASVPQAKPWVSVRWRDLCGAEERSESVAAPRSGAACSDSSRLLEHSERSERREFRDGPRVRAPEGILRAANGRRITSDAAYSPAVLPARSFAISSAAGSRHETADARRADLARRARHRLLRRLRRGVVDSPRFGGFVLEDLPRRPDDDARERLDAAHDAGLRAGTSA